MTKIVLALFIIAAVLMAIIAMWLGDAFYNWRQQEKLKAKQAASRLINKLWLTKGK